MTRAGSYAAPLRRFTLLAVLGVFVLLGRASEVRADGLGPLTVRGGSELSVYQDTDATTVLTPVVFAGVENVLGGWGVNGSFLVDVVSTASADIVATASTRWSEVRYAPAVGAHKRFGDADVALRAAASSEPDYLSISGGASLTWDFAQKTVTPTLSYDFAHDTLGRAGTPFSVFSRPIARHTASLQVELVMNKSTLFVPYLSGIVETGDTSKPYRFIPMFDAANALLVQPGMTPKLRIARRESLSME